MPQPPETITVETDKFYCDGTVGERLRGAQSEPVSGNNEPGHPRVFLTVAKSGAIDCPYCGRHFVLAKGAKSAAAH